MKTPTGQMVYAYAAEIDAWRRSLDPTVAIPNVEPGRPGAPESVPEYAQPLALPDTAQSLKTGSTERPRWRTFVAIAATLAVVVAAGASWLAVSRATGPRAASRFSVVGNTFVATDASGREAWSYRFPGRVAGMRHTLRDRQPVVVDFDRDGMDEVLVAVHIESSGPGEPWHESLYCFTRTGHLRWIYTPDLSLSFNGTPFDGPWRLYDFAAGGIGGAPAVWVSVGDHTWWPSAVVRIDRDGGARLQFVQSGAIYALALWHARSGHYLVAGGVNNDYGLASVAVIDPNGPQVTSPQAAPAYRCDGCPNRGPLYYALLPRTELSVASGVPYSHVGGLDAVGDELRINTNEGPGALVHFLSGSFRIDRSAFTDGYWAGHADLERTGALKHSAADCPARNAEYEIRTWTPAQGWKTAKTVMAH